MTQGAISSNFYLIEEGVCEVSVDLLDERTGATVKKLLSTMERGQHFGEMALLPGNPKARTATVAAVTSVRCLGLDRDTFQRLIGVATAAPPCE